MASIISINCGASAAWLDTEWATMTWASSSTTAWALKA